MDTPVNSPSAVTDRYDRLWIVLSHLSLWLGVGIVLPLVIYLVKKDESAAVAYHAKEALNFHISVYIYTAVCVLLALVFIGIPLLILLWLGALVLAIIGAVRGADGVEYRYPMTLRLVP